MKAFSELNIPITIVAEIMNHLGVSSTELNDPRKFEKFKYIADFVKDIPNMDRFFTRLNKAGQINVDKMNFFYEYCNHRTVLENTLKQKAFIEEQWIKTGDEMLFEELQAFGPEIEEIHSTIDAYEN
jgi:hypothetical protein